jgi:hypothetical protein
MSPGKDEMMQWRWVAGGRIPEVDHACINCHPRDNYKCRFRLSKVLVYLEEPKVAIYCNWKALGISNRKDGGGDFSRFRGA